ERVELVDHRVDGVLELEDLALDVHADLPGQVAARHRRGDLGDVAHLAGQVRRHEVHVVGEVLPRAGDAGHDGLAAPLAVRPVFPPLSTPPPPRVLPDSNALSWSTIVLMVFFSSRISPLTSTVILRDRSPRAIDVATSAMLRTWPVRFDAIQFTLSVRSFHVP